MSWPGYPGEATTFYMHVPENSAPIYYASGYLPLQSSNQSISLQFPQGSFSPQLPGTLPFSAPTAHYYIPPAVLPTNAPPQEEWEDQGFYGSGYYQDELGTTPSESSTFYPPSPDQAEQEESCPLQIPDETVSDPSTKPKTRKKVSKCSFCKSNGETSEKYSNHTLFNAEQETACPVLFKYVCPICGKTGKEAHTVKYCPNLIKNKGKRRRGKKAGYNAIGNPVSLKF